MRTLDLVNKETSDIKYTPSNFPDGQQSITIDDFSRIDDVIIKSRFNSFKDLELILCSTSALRKITDGRIQLFIPYFLGARSDRKFAHGSIHYIKDIISPIINSQNYDKVIVFDPHSDVLEACINNLEKIDNFNLVKTALTQIDNKNDARERIVLVSPDAGAYKKIFDVARHFEITKLITASKVRDLYTGKILRTEVPNLSEFHPKSKFVIIDDICDGGRTFIEVAKAIECHVWPHDEYFSGEIHLIVSHGIFSNGFDELEKHLTSIHTTNSVKDLTPQLSNIKISVTQINLF